MKKRLCFLTLALLTVAGLSSWAAQPKTNEGEGPFKIGDTSYSTLAEAINNVPSDGTITMTENVTDATGISVSSGKYFTVDFGEHTYTCASDPAGSTGTQNQVFQLLEGSTIIFKNGTINVKEDAKSQFRFIIQNYANLTLEDITLDGTNLAFPDKVRYTVSNNSGNVVFKGATIKAATEKGIAFDVCKYDTYPVPTVTWTAGTSAGTVNGGIELSGGKFVVATDLAVDRPIVAIDDEDVQSVSSTLTINSGATISTASTFQDLTPGISGPGVTSLVQVRRGADLTIDGAGSIEAGAQTYSAVMVTVNNDNAEKTAKLTVNGQVTITGDYYGIVGNGNRRNTEITVNGGTIKGTHTNDNHGIYHPQNGSLTINGESTQIIGYNNGIEMRAGNLVVNNGTIIGTATNTTVVPNGNGSTTKGAGIAIATHTTNLPISVTINKGTITGAQAISNANPQNVDAEVTVVINGGTFSDMSGVNYVADNATYTLGADVDNAKGMIINTEKTFTVDFGGHTYTVNKPGAGSTNTQTQAFQLIAGQNITFKNGTIKAADANLNATSEGDVKPIKRFIQNYANLTLTNMTFDGTNINGENSVVEFCNGNVTIDGTTNFTAKSGVASINVDSWKGSYPNGTAVTINTTGNVGKIHCYTEGTGSMTTKSSLTIKNGKNITIDDVSNGEVTISVEGGEFTDLYGIVYAASGATYKLGNDVAKARGIKIPAGKNFTVDFQNHKYAVECPGAGSSATQTQGFQINSTPSAKSTITFKNGTIECTEANKNATWQSGSASKGIAMLIQDYADLTLENMTIDGTNIAHNGNNVRYILSSNYGDIDIKGNTSIIAPEGDIAFDVYDNKANSDASYPGVPTVTVNTTGTITGQVEVTGGNLVVDAGTFKTTAVKGNAQSSAILVKSGSVIFNDGTVTSEHNMAVCVKGGSATLNDGIFTGVEGAVNFLGSGATINITGGTYIATDNAVLAGNGAHDGDANTVNISGGTFTGGIKSTSYIACGIYAPWRDNITVNGGTFNITNGAGVVARAGVVTINGGKFKVSGTGTGWVGDSQNQISCKCLVFDANANYPAKDDNSKIIVNGGLFSDDSAKDYHATGKSVFGNTDKDYPYVVATATTGSVEIAENVSISATEGTTLSSDDQTTVKNAVESITTNTDVTTLPEETQEKNEAAVATVLTEDQSVCIAIELTGIVASVETNGQTTVKFSNFVYDVTPYVVENNAVTAKIDNNDIKAPMTFRLPIPSSVTANYARVSHKHDGKTTDLGLKQIQGTSDNKYIEITTNSFSEFAVEMSDVEVTAPTTLYYYAGNSSKHSATPAEFLSAKANYANAIAFVDKAYANWASTQTNVVVKYPAGSNYYYECPNFVLTDLKDFYTPVDFHVVNGSYTRTNTRGLNTVCLPFELSSADVNNGQIGVFHSTDMYNGTGFNNSGSVYFNVVGNVNPGTPCIIKCSSTDAGWNIDLAGKTVAANPNNVNALKGSYVEETIGAGVYKVDNKGEKFGKTTSVSETVVPFRAYLDLKYGSGMETNVKDLNIEWADDATGIENVKVASDSKVIYDLTGRMVNNPVKGGLYIINGKKVIFK